MLRPSGGSTRTFQSEVLADCLLKIALKQRVQRRLLVVCRLTGKADKGLGTMRWPTLQGAWAVIGRGWEQRHLWLSDVALRPPGRDYGSAFYGTWRCASSLRSWVVWWPVLDPEIKRRF